MFKKAYLFVMAAIVILLPSILTAQAPDTVWTRRYNGPADSTDNAFSCAVDDSGNLYVTGWSDDGTNKDYLTIKYNANGDTLWSKRYDSQANLTDKAYGCAVDRMGNLYVTGGSINSTLTLYDYLTIKYNSDGDTLWTRRYDGFGDSSYDFAHACAVDDSGNLYVTGRSGYWGSFIYTIKYNTYGDTLWTRSLYSSYCEANACAIDDSGNVYITGLNYNGSGYDYLTIKFNSIGDILWTRVYNSPVNGWGSANGCAVDGLGNIYITGYSPNGVNYDYLTIKYNTAGDTLWTRRYNSPANGDDYAFGCAVNDSGALYVTGESYNGTSYYNYLTIKYNAAGDTMWTRSYNGAADGYDAGCSCGVDGSGSLYVTGISSNGTNNDYLTIKYNTKTGVAGKPELPMTVSKLRLEQNKPNPFSQHTTISYQLPASGTASLKIYNAAGQLVKSFDMGQQQAGHHQVEWSDSKITAGVYFYRLTAGNYQATKKLVVLK